MSPSKPARKAATSKPKKEKVFHPDSRKAGQMARTQLRKVKMMNQASKRGEKGGGQADKYGFFFHALPPEGMMTLEDMHNLIRDVWLARHDAELEEERAARRKGRPKSSREVKLEEMILQDQELYRTGVEVVDLTHAANVKLFRQWDLTEVPYCKSLRHIRLNSANTQSYIVTRIGSHPSLQSPDMDMDVIPTPPPTIPLAAPLPLDAPLKFGSSMMFMDP